MKTTVLSEAGVDYTKNSNCCIGWKSTETNIKCGDARFFNGKLHIVDYMIPNPKKRFKEQTYGVFWKEYELNNRYHVQDVEERLEKLIAELGDNVLKRSESLKLKDDLLDMFTKVVLDVARLKKSLQEPSPWASASHINTLQVDFETLKVRFEKHISADISNNKPYGSAIGSTGGMLFSASVSE